MPCFSCIWISDVYSLTLFQFSLIKTFTFGEETTLISFHRFPVRLSPTTTSQRKWEVSLKYLPSKTVGQAKSTNSSLLDLAVPREFCTHSAPSFNITHSGYPVSFMRVGLHQANWRLGQNSVSTAYLSNQFK